MDRIWIAHGGRLPRPDLAQTLLAQNTHAFGGKDLHGLYLAGGAAHPGPGMPMVMMSGWIAADSLDTDAKSGKLATLTA